MHWLWPKIHSCQCWWSQCDPGKVCTLTEGRACEPASIGCRKADDTVIQHWGCLLALSPHYCHAVSEKKKKQPKTSSLLKSGQVTFNRPGASFLWLQNLQPQYFWFTHMCPKILLTRFCQWQARWKSYLWNWERQHDVEEGNITTRT